MAECKQISFGFPTCKSRKVLADFNGGDVTSDGGVLLLRQVDKKLGLTRRLNEILKDKRSQGHCDHDQLRLLRQRIYALALGYEDINDHSTLRKDTALQTAVEASEDLARTGLIGKPRFAYQNFWWNSLSCHSRMRRMNWF